MIKNSSFQYASLAMNILERLLGTRFSVSGVENIPSQPVMFVANHFTRSETFFVPYIINRLINRNVRCLADHKLFYGVFGKFLTSVGTLSTKDPNRDNIIIKDLVCGDYDWMIYPEGSMVKSKEIKFDGLYVSYTPHRIGPVRTGAAVLALKSQLYRNDLLNFNKTNNQFCLNEYKLNFGLDFSENIANLQTQIVPVNITYYPLRPGNNHIKSLANRLIKNLPKQIAEELEIEGNILLNSQIDLNFGKPINLQNYINSAKNIIDKIPIINYETKNNFVIKYYRSRLTNDFMNKIYQDIQINFDHIFVATLSNFTNTKISINHLKRIIYYSSLLLFKSKKYRLNKSIFEDNVFKIFAHEKYQEFDDVFDLAIKQNLIKKLDDKIIEINKNQLNKKYDFHEIRLENTLQVIARELDLVDGINSIIKRVCLIDNEKLKELVFQNILDCDIKNFENDYNKNYDPQFSKPAQIGQPFFIDPKIIVNEQIQNLGVVLVHGYKSAPEEVRALANFLTDCGLKIYVVRLAGHGTAPHDLKNFSWCDWYNSALRGYCALNNICQNIAIIGFSTGGLLSLLSASQKKLNNKLTKIISINSALKLLDIKTRMVPTINLWNEILEKFNLEKGRLEYIDDLPENPHINYSRNYIRGVYELEKLMDFCNLNLNKINIPTLVIQAKSDPVVNPISGKLIYNKINTPNKKLVEIDANNHVIITGEKKQIVFQEIIDFLLK
jgi:esterase/lipase/1-acyl-sn-glycerol-3-phosphate acyltransferase